MRCDDPDLVACLRRRLGEAPHECASGIVREARIVMGGDENAHRTRSWRKLAAHDAQATGAQSSGNGAGSRHSQIGIDHEGDNAGRDLEHGEPEAGCERKDDSLGGRR